MEERFSRPNVTPLTDVAFTLLITLMVATAFINVKPPPFQVLLPTAQTVEPRGAETVTVDINRDGTKIAVQGKPVIWENYIQFIKEEAISNPYRLLLIRADEDTPHGIVLNVLGHIKRLNLVLKSEGYEPFERIAFGTRKKE